MPRFANMHRCRAASHRVDVKVVHYVGETVRRRGGFLKDELAKVQKIII